MTRYTQAIFLLIKWQYRIVANLSPLLLPAHHCIKDDIVFLPPLKCMDGSDFHVPYPGMIEPVSQVVYHTSERYDDTNPFHKDSAIPHIFQQSLHDRSEERRVGKECT